MIVAEPVSRAAAWSRRLAVFALAVVGLAVALARMRAVEPTAALTVFAAGLSVAGLALLLAVAAASSIWRMGLRGAGQAFVGAALSLGLLAYPAYLAGLAFALPMIADVSTDLAAPPAFLRSAKVAEAGAGEEPRPPTDAERAAQARAYPDLQTLKVEIDPLAAYRLALSTAADLGWRIVDLRAPNPHAGDAAAIQAIDRSTFFGFPSDIVIRIRPGANTTQIDMRSVARVGRHDFGAGAARIRRFAAAVREAPGDR